MEQVQIKLSPCPWCKNTPDVILNYDTSDTWKWRIQCLTETCPTKPATSVNVRKKQKCCVEDQLKKLGILVDKWNLTNPMKPIALKFINIEHFKKAARVARGEKSQ